MKHKNEKTLSSYKKNPSIFFKDMNDEAAVLLFERQGLCCYSQITCFKDWLFSKVESIKELVMFSIIPWHIIDVFDIFLYHLWRCFHRASSKLKICWAPEFLGHTALHRAHRSILVCSVPLAHFLLPLWSKHSWRWVHSGVADAQRFWRKRMSTRCLAWLLPFLIHCHPAVMVANTGFQDKTAWLQSQFLRCCSAVPSEISGLNWSGEAVLPQLDTCIISTYARHQQQS